MCDYSLASVKSRAATVGDKLVTKNFGTGTTGFADVDDQETAVCVRPGTEIAFECNIHRYVLQADADRGYATAIFRQVGRDYPHTHHDALELPNGEIILLTHVASGLHATILQLPAEPKTAEETKQQQCVEFVG